MNINVFIKNHFSYLPWFEIFYSLLNQLAEMLNHNGDRDMTAFLRAAYVQDVPAPGMPVTIAANQEVRIHDNRDILDII